MVTKLQSENRDNDLGAAIIVLLIISGLAYGIADLGSQPECLCAPEQQDD